MKQKLYLETTIPSYLTSRQSRDVVSAGHQETTREWWTTQRENFDIFVSIFVLDEITYGNPDAAQDRLRAVEKIPLLEITDSVLDLASLLIRSGVIPTKAARDAGYVAVAAVHNMDYLMTWNCAHIANAKIIRRIEQVCREAGLVCPVICTPEELMGE